QVMLGEEVANNLLTSPALSSIVKATSAQVAQDDLISAFKAASTVPSPTATPAGATPAPAPLGRTQLFSGFTRSSTLLKTTVQAPLVFGRQITSSAFAIEGADVASAPQIDTARSFKGTSLLGVELGSQTIPTRSDVVNAEPVVGKGFDLRTLTIAKRFDVGPTRTAFDFADAGLIEVLSQVTAVDLG